MLELPGSRTAWYRAFNPELQEELDEAVQFCDLMVVGHPEDALDGAKRAKSFYALDMGRLVVALRRYREVDQSLFGHNPQLPKVNQRATFDLDVT